MSYALSFLNVSIEGGVGSALTNERVEATAAEVNPAGGSAGFKATAARGKARALDVNRCSRYDPSMGDMIVIFGGLALGEALASSDPNAGFNWDLLLMLSLLMLAVCLLVRYMIKNPN